MTRTILVGVALLAIPVALHAQPVPVNCTPDRLPIGGVAALPSGAREWRCMNIPEPRVPDRAASSSSATSGTDNAVLVGSILQQSIGALGMFLSMRQAEAAEAAALAEQRQAAYRVAVEQQRQVELSRFRQGQQQTLSQMKGGGGSLEWKTGVGEVITNQARLDQLVARVKPGIQSFLNEYESGVGFLLDAVKYAEGRRKPATPPGPPAPPLTAVALGRVEFADGGVIVRRGDRAGALAAGTPLQAGDRVVTGRSGSVIFTLEDGVRFSLGPNTGLGVEEFVVSPGRPTTLRARLYQGAMRWLSDPASHEQTRNAQVTTTTAVVAVRGTDFVAEYAEADGIATLVIRVDDGRVDVTPLNGTMISLGATESHVLRTPVRP